MPLNPVIASFERFRLRLSRLHPDHFRIARAAFWVGLFTFSAKLIAAGKEMAVAWRYGRGPEVDAYNLALTLSTWLPVTMVSVLTMVLLPIIVKQSAVDQVVQRKQFLAELNGLAWGGALLTFLLIWGFGTWGLSWYVRGLDRITLEMTREMLFAFIPVAILTLFIGIAALRMQASHDHRYSLADGFPPLAIILCLWAWQTADGLPLVAGTLLGTALQMLWLASLARSHDGAVGVSCSVQSNEWKILWRSALIIGLAQFARSFSTPIDHYYAANFGAGSIATLGYANRLVALCMALGATIISRATLPIFSEAAAEGHIERIRNLAFKWICVMFIVGSVVAAMLWMLAPWVLEVIYQRGAFSAEDTKEVANIFSYSLIQIPAFFSLMILSSLLASTGQYMASMWSAVVFLLLKLVITPVLCYSIGLGGIALSNAVAYMASLVLLLLICYFPNSRFAARRSMDA